MGAVLIGGRSRRMGTPKHLLPKGEITWIEHIVSTLQSCLPQVILIGEGCLPQSLSGLTRLDDVPNRPGPVGGMLAAMHWKPDYDWVFAACDLPLITPSAIAWLLDQATPDILAVMPQLPGAGSPEPLLAFYDRRCRALLEDCSAPLQLLETKLVKTPVPPPSLAPAWTNINTPEQAALLERSCA